MTDSEKRTRGETRPVDKRLEAIKRKVAALEKAQSRTGQQALARSRILVGLAALTTAEKDTEFARTLAASIRSYCTSEGQLRAVAEALDDLDQMIGKS